MSDAGPPALEPGHVLGAYRIGRRVGVGGMGSVYEATHVPDGRRVAVKVLHADAAHDAEVRRRFLHEAEVVARVRHPNIVTVAHADASDGVTFLVMDLLDGEDLAARLAREGPLPPAEAVDLVLAATAAIAAAHAAGVIHRDLKPANLFLARDARGVTPKVLDFGVSKLLGRVGDSTHTAALLGSPHYMSPEQARSSKRVDWRTDQYALGVILYECLAGCRPFHGATLFELVYAITHEDPPPPSERAPAVPPGLDAVVRRAMAREADARFASLRDFGAALLPFASPDAKRLWRKEFGGTWARRGPAVAIALALLGGAAWLAATRPASRAASSLPPPAVHAPARDGSVAPPTSDASTARDVAPPTTDASTARDVARIDDVPRADDVVAPPRRAPSRPPRTPRGDDDFRVR
ncbi:MAG: serine/threonine-protein kinase [Polyangiales bacterium]